MGKKLSVEGLRDLVVQLDPPFAARLSDLEDSVSSLIKQAAELTNDQNTPAPNDGVTTWEITETGARVFTASGDTARSVAIGLLAAALAEVDKPGDLVLRVGWSENGEFEYEGNVTVTF